LICDFSFEVNLLATSIRIALATSGKRFFEFFLETFQRSQGDAGARSSFNPKPPWSVAISVRMRGPLISNQLPARPAAALSASNNIESPRILPEGMDGSALQSS
jgi:hypothetical protein